LKFFFYRSKLQAGSSKDDYQPKSHLIRAITRPRPTTACSGQLAVRQKAVVKREKAGSRTGIYLMIIIGNASLYFGTLEEESLFFRGFFVAQDNQKIRILALGRRSIIASQKDIKNQQKVMYKKKTPKPSQSQKTQKLTAARRKPHQTQPIYEPNDPQPLLSSPT
jgi:hypothetical protein